MWLADCLCYVLLQGRTKTFQKRKKRSFLRLFPLTSKYYLSYVWNDRIRFFLLWLSLKTLSDGKLPCLIFSQWLIWSFVLLVHS